MNILKKIALLSSVTLLSLMACDFEKKCYCLETSNDADYHAGMCYQATNKDIVEVVYLINPPLNPDKGEDEEYKYDIIWNDSVKISDITFTDGLEGKKLVSAFKIGANVLKLQIEHSLNNPEATSGYIKVSRYAFKALTERVKEAYLYAYVAIGATADLVNKPAEE